MYTGLVGGNLDSQLNGAQKGPEKCRTDGLIHTKCVKSECVRVKMWVSGAGNKNWAEIWHNRQRKGNAKCCSGMWILYVRISSGVLVWAVRAGCVLPVWAENGRGSQECTEGKGLHGPVDRAGNEVNDGGAGVACSSLTMTRPSWQNS